MHIEEIKNIVARLDNIQKARNISANQLLREYPDIGSSKTWTDRLLPLLAGSPPEGIHLERTLRRLKRVAAILDGGSPDEIFWPEMGFASEMIARLKKLENQTNDRRILVCLAPNGCGKSAFARWAVARDPIRRCYVRMRPTWRNRAVHICSGIARALSLSIQSSNPAEVEQTVIDSLNSKPKTLFVDQAHEGGVQLMHELRAFVDETQSRFVYLAYDTAFKRVQTANTDALIEAQAFIGRCLKPPFDLYRNGIAAQDAAFFLEKSGLSRSQAISVAVAILPTLRGHTNLRLLDDAIESAQDAIESKNGHAAKSLSQLIIDEVTSKATGADKTNEVTNEAAK